MKVSVVSIGLTALVTACADGYAPGEKSLSLHFQMTQVEAMSALNTIGSREHLPQIWHYQLKDGCQLEVTTRTGALKKQVHTANLNTTELLMFKPNTGKQYSVALRPRNDDGPITILLSGGTWSDASMVKWLLDFIPRFCLQRQG